MVGRLGLIALPWGTVGEISEIQTRDKESAILLSHPWIWAAQIMEILGSLYKRKRYRWTCQAEETRTELGSAALHPISPYHGVSLQIWRDQPGDEGASLRNNMHCKIKQRKQLSFWNCYTASCAFFMTSLMRFNFSRGREARIKLLSKVMPKKIYNLEQIAAYPI